MFRVPAELFLLTFQAALILVLYRAPMMKILIDDEDSADIVDFDNLTDCDADDNQQKKKCPFILSEASEVEDDAEEEP